MTWNQTLAGLVVGAASLISICVPPDVSVEASTPEVAVVNVSPEAYLSNALDSEGHLLSSKAAYTSNSTKDPVVKSSITNIPQNNKDSIWNHLRAEFKLQLQGSAPGVTTQRGRYIENADYLEHVLKRSTPYLYFITEEIEKRHLPAELIVVPLIESAFDPYALSHANAAGLWQIVPGTAKYFNLVQNNWYDGRYDVYASTKAALDHLSYLNELFKGNWILTLAAYNTGQGNLQRAIERNRNQGKSTDFWSLRVATETRLYVQRFIALVDIIRNNKKYGIELPYIANQPALILVKPQQQTNLKRVAEIAGINFQEFHRLNAGYVNRRANATPPQGPHHLLIPINQSKPYMQQVAHLQTAVNSNSAKASSKQVNNSEGFHKVQRGDTLIKIATKYDISVAQLRKANHLSINSTLIVPGQELLLPVSN